MKCSFVCWAFLLASSYGLPMLEPGKDDPNLGNLVDVAQSLGLSDLIKTAEPFGIVTELKTGQSLTLFGPTNEAFRSIPSIYKKVLMNSTILEEVLYFHLVDSVVYADAIKNELLVPSSLTKTSIRFNVYGKVVTAQCSKIEMVNQNASNGVIHVLSRVMIPPLLGTVTELVVMLKHDFSILLKAVLTAHLQDVLAGPGPFTVFAPTNDAFLKIPPEELKKILKDIPLLTKILKYHVVAGTFCSAGLTDKATVPTLEGTDVTIHIAKKVVTVNGKRVDYADVPVSNGVVHVIDSVLIPEHLYR